MEGSSFLVAGAEAVLVLSFFWLLESLGALFFRVMLFADFEATARFFPTEEAFLAPLVLEAFFTIIFAETARCFETEEAFLTPLDILFLLLFFELVRGIF